MATKKSPAPRAKMLEVLAQFRVVVKSIRSHYQDVERRAGLTGAQLWALSEIAKRPDCQVGQLAQALAIHQSTASNLLRVLAKLGLVTRQRRGKDQRHVQLSPTRKGLQVLKNAPQPLMGVLQQALSNLPVASLDSLHGQLAKLIKGMKIKSLQAARSTPLSDM
jgi:DNA-binding MarR family transcriptional regulator